MASRNDGDVEDKGRRLWDALKNEEIDRVDRRSNVRELLQNGAPSNFREPGQVRKLTAVIIAFALHLTLTCVKRNTRVHRNLIQRTDRVVWWRTTAIRQNDINLLMLD